MRPIQYTTTTTISYPVYEKITRLIAVIISLVIPSRLTPCYMYKLYTHLTETILLIFEMSSVLLFCFCTKHPNYVQFLNYYEGAFLIVNPCPPPPHIYVLCLTHAESKSKRKTPEKG